MTAAGFVLATLVVVVLLIAAIAAWETWTDRRRKREPDPFGDDRPSDEAIRLLRKRNGRTL